MHVISPPKLDYDDVLIRPKRSTLTSRKEVDLERELRFLHSSKVWKGVPIVTANTDASGNIELAQELVKHKMVTFLHKFYSVDELAKALPELNAPAYVCYTMGIREGDFEKLQEVMDKGLHKYFDFVCLDVPNGYISVFTKYIKMLRGLLPEHIIVAGNVVTNEMAEDILLHGADIVKVGIGPGSACTTRRQTGVGYPQLSAVMETADAAHGISTAQGRYGLIIADGGAKYCGCVAKAFCAGADFVMMGGMFAGYDQSGGDLVERDGKKYKEYNGSSSTKVMKKHYGKIDAHRASEGRELLVPYRGDVRNFIQELLGSLRSTGTYIGARRIKSFARRATFIQVNRQLNTWLASHDTA